MQHHTAMDLCLLKTVQTLSPISWLPNAQPLVFYGQGCLKAFSLPLPQPTLFDSTKQLTFFPLTSIRHAPHTTWRQTSEAHPQGGLGGLGTYDSSWLNSEFSFPPSDPQPSKTVSCRYLWWCQLNWRASDHCSSLLSAMSFRCMKSFKALCRNHLTRNLSMLVGNLSFIKEWCSSRHCLIFYFGSHSTRRIKQKGNHQKTTMEPDGVEEKAKMNLWGFREGDEGTGQVFKMGWPRLNLNQEAHVKQDQMAECSETTSWVIKLNPNNFTLGTS